jgi:hypothetical protein
MKAGDKVRLTTVPPNIPEGDTDLPTKATFDRCLGHEFVVNGFNEIGWVEIEISEVTGLVGETIWVETDYLEQIST